MAHIVVTGAGGFLGRHLTRRLTQRGDVVRAFGHPPPNDDEPRMEVAEFIRGDVRAREAVAQAVSGADAVVHLVSNFRRGGSDKAEAAAINVDGTQNVLDAAVTAGVKRLVHCSTIGVHGDVRVVPADETAPFNPGDLYQETKLAGERRVWDCYERTGLPVTVVRPISMFGPGDRRMLKLFRMIKAGRFVMVGDGKALFQPAYIADVVEGFVACLDSDTAVGETFIVGGDEYVSLRELVGLIADALHVPPPRLRIPMTPVVWAAAACERVCVPLGIEPPLHRRRVSFFRNTRAFTIAKARRLLGYEPQVSLSDGIRRTIRWYEDHGWL